MQVDDMSKRRASLEAEGEPCQINLLSFLERYLRDVTFTIDRMNMEA